MVQSCLRVLVFFLFVFWTGAYVPEFKPMKLPSDFLPGEDSSKTVGELETEFAQIQQDVDSQTEVLGNLQQSVDDLEKNVSTTTQDQTEIETTLTTKIEKITQRIIALEQKKKAASCEDHPAGYKEEAGMCIRMENYINPGWMDAEKICKMDGGHLVKVDSREKNTYLSNKYGSNGHIWIGASDEAVEGQWVWADGTPVEFSNWQSQAISEDTSLNCATIKAGTWFASQCADQYHPFICEISTDPKTSNVLR